MADRQVRIFAPPSGPYDGPLWAETVLGHIIKPLISGHPMRKPIWYHFFRYRTAGWDDTDCEMSLVPKEFADADGLYRSVRFRYSMHSEWTEFEERGQRLIITAGCLATHWLDYDVRSDLGGERFFSAERARDHSFPQLRRMELVAAFIHSTCELVLNCLAGPDEKGIFHLEESQSRQNRQGSIFESLHHLFCNTTQVPLRVRVPKRHRSLMLGTDYYPQDLVNWNQYQNIPIRF